MWDFTFFSWLELVLCSVQYGHEKDWDSRGLSECVYTKMANTFSKPIIELSILSISVYHYLFVWHLLRRRIEISWHISIHVYWRGKKMFHIHRTRTRIWKKFWFFWKNYFVALQKISLILRKISGSGKIFSWYAAPQTTC